MRNFFKNKFTRKPNVESKQQIAELLDTDEDRIINQYNKYSKYINRVKNEIIQRSKDLLQPNRQLHTR